MAEAWKYHSETTRGGRTTWPVYPASGPVRTIAMCYSEEDARMVAALPELLEAAKEAAESLRDGGERMDIACLLDLAVAKAEGRS